MTTQTFLSARATATRAAGRLIVARLESGDRAATQPGGELVASTGLVKGLDIEPAAAILLSGVSHKRRVAALRALNA